MIPHKGWKLVTAATLAIMFSGCGGGGGGGAVPSPPIGSAPTPGPSPAPSPTPSPSPTPPPGPVALAGPAALTQIENFAVLGWTFRYVTTREGAYVRGSREPETDGIAFRFLAAEQVHEMLIPGYDWGRLQAPEQAGREFSFQNVLIANTAESIGYRLSLFLPGSENPRLALTHTSLGYWTAGGIDPADSSLVQ